MQVHDAPKSNCAVTKEKAAWVSFHWEVYEEFDPYKI